MATIKALFSGNREPAARDSLIVLRVKNGRCKKNKGIHGLDTAEGGG